MKHSKQINRIKALIESAMGDDYQRFTVQFFEVLTSEPDNFSAHFTFQPVPFEYEGVRFKGGACTMQFGIDEVDDIIMIVGEDTEIDVTLFNIYSCLYWNEAIEEETKITTNRKQEIQKLRQTEPVIHDAFYSQRDSGATYEEALEIMVLSLVACKNNLFESLTRLIEERQSNTR